MLRWLNTIAEIICLVIYEYINTSFRLILRPRTAFRCLCKYDGGNYISSNLYFLISIFIIQATSLIRDRVSNKENLEYLSTWNTGLEMPVVGTVGFSYVFNFVGFFVGASCILFMLMSLIKGSVMDFKIIKDVVLYSVVIISIFSFFDYLIFAVIIILSCAFTDTDISFIGTLKTNYVVEIIDNCMNCTLLVLGNDIIYSYLFLFVYVFYLWYLLRTFITYKRINKWLTGLFLVICIFITGASSLFKYNILYNELRRIEASTSKIQTYKSELFGQEDSEKNMIKAIFRRISLKDEYLLLSNNKLLSEKEKLETYRVYLQIKYSEYGSKDGWEKHGITFLSSNILAYDEDRIREILEKLDDCCDVQRLYELEDLAAEEAIRCKNMSSFEIFLSNFNKEYKKEYASNIVMGSLLKVMP